jgi:hypothetical protein
LLGVVVLGWMAWRLTRDIAKNEPAHADLAQDRKPE